MASIILIDLSSIFWTLWHASESQDVSFAKRRTIEIVESLSRDHDYAAVCVDKGPYKRNEIFADYKKGREHPPMAIEELRNCAKELMGFGIKCYAADGYEADDVIATLADQAGRQGIEVYIAGKDKDLLQIQNVKITDPFERKEITSQEKFGCPSGLVVDVLALSGDTADNVPGIAGIGPKRALQVIEVIGGVKEFIEGKYDRTEFLKLPESIRTSMLEGYDNLKMSYELVKLEYSVPVTLVLGQKRDVGTAAEASQPSEDKDPKRHVTQPQASEPATPVEAIPVIASKSEVAIRSDARNANWSLALEPVDLNAAWKLSCMMYESRMFGQFPNNQAIMAIILRGRSLGMDATTALSNFHVVEGKPTMHASLIVGLVLNSGKCEYFDLVESTDKVATWVTKRIGARNEVKMSYTIEEAGQADLLKPSASGKKSNWMKRPKTQLRHRAATELARAVYPDITTGLYTKDEITDGRESDED